MAAEVQVIHCSVLFRRYLLSNNDILFIHYLTFLVFSTIIFSILGGCSSVVERQIVDLVVVGSNPITHPYFRAAAWKRCACSSAG